MFALRRGVLRVAGVALASVGLIAASQTAGATSGSVEGHGGSPPVISIDVTTDGGFEMPDKVQAGLVTFKVSSPEAAFHLIQGFRLKGGATLEQVMDELDKALSGDPVVAPANISKVREHLTDIGGISTTPYAPQAITVPLYKGTYYFLDISTVANPPMVPEVHELKVVGDFKNTRMPRIDSAVVMKDTGAVPGYASPKNLPNKGNIFVYHAGQELQQLAFRPTRPGITDAYISTFYDAIRAGTTPPESPWTGAQAGMAGLSHGQWAILHVDLPPGPYAMLCVVPSIHEPGWPHAYIGTHKVVNLG
jgi:hypothetical protein